MLVIRAIKGHLNLRRVLGVRLREIHRSKPSRFVVWTSLLGLCKCYLVFLCLGVWLCTEFGVEGRLIVLLKVMAVGVCNRYIVKKFGTTKHKSFFQGCCPSQDFERIICQYT